MNMVAGILGSSSWGMGLGSISRFKDSFSFSFSDKNTDSYYADP